MKITSGSTLVETPIAMMKSHSADDGTGSSKSDNSKSDFDNPFSGDIMSELDTPAVPITARDRVLQAAEQLFMERGYAAITLRDIAAALDIRQASLYYHFPKGKEELFVAVVEGVFARYHHGIVTIIAEADEPIADKLVAIASWYVKQPAFNLSGMMHADMPVLSSENQAQLFESAGQSIFIPIRGIIENGLASKEITAVHADLATGIFLSIMDGIRTRILQNHDNNHDNNHDRNDLPPNDVMAAEVVRMLLDGMRPRNE